MMPYLIYDVRRPVHQDWDRIGVRQIKHCYNALLWHFLNRIFLEAGFMVFWGGEREFPLL